MSNVPYGMWADYFELLLAVSQAKPTTLLDVCCGTGILCEEMLERGYRPTGFDLSPGMIDEARAKAIARDLDIRYEVADAAEVDLGCRFDAAYSFFDSLNYIVDPPRLRQAIARVAAHLETGAPFAFDLNTAYAFEQRMFDQQSLRPGAKVRYRWRGEYDPQTLLIRVDMRFWVGGEEFEEVHWQRAHPLGEVEEALRVAGFARVDAFDSYTLEPVRKKSDRVHFLAIKA